MAEIFVILYELPVYNRPELWPRLLWNRPTDEGAWPFNSHFIATFKPHSWQPQYLWPPPQDFSTPSPSTPGNPHFIAAFRPHSWTPQYLWAPNSDIPPSTPGNPHFIARYNEPKLYRPTFIPPEDFSTPVNSESGANPHFIARFQQPEFIRRLFPQPTDAPAFVTPETNPHFVATYTAPVWKQQYLWSPPSDVPAATPTFETNVHFIASYNEPKLYRPIFPQPTDGASIVVPDVPTYFLAKFAPLVWRQQFLWLPAEDFSTPTATFETNIHFLAKYVDPVFRIDTMLWKAVPSDIPAAVVVTDVQHLWGFSIIKRPL